MAIFLIIQWKNRNYFIEAKTIASQLNGSSDAILIKQLSHNHSFQRPDAVHLQVDSTLEKLTGHGGLIKVGKKGGKWNFSAEGQYRSPGLNLNDMGYIRQSDYFGERTEASYDMNEPTKWIRDYNIEVYQEARWSLGSESNLNMVGADFSISNLKLWSFYMTFRYDFSHVDPRELRGGPALRNDPFYMLGFSARTNTSKDLYSRLGYFHNGSQMEHFSNDMFNISITWLPVRRVRLSAIMNFSQQQHYQQYVTTISWNSSVESIVGNIERNTASFTLRGELFMTPEISLQYYGNPYYSVGNYDSFRRVDQAGSHDLNERFELLSTSFDEVDNVYNIDIGTETHVMDNPDFSFIQYRSNVVFRWEYNPGSTIYFVWSHDRSDWRTAYNPVSEITGDLFGLQGSNVFMMKLNYWFSL